MSMGAEPVTPALRSILYRLGVAISHRRRIVLCGGTLVLMLCAALNPSLQKALGPPSSVVEGSESQQVEQLLARRFPALGTEDDAVVFYSAHHVASEQVYRQMVASVLAMVRRQDGVRTTLSPYDPDAVGQISSDEHAAVAAVVLDGNIRQRYDRARAIQHGVLRTASDGVRAWLTGFSPVAVDLSNVNDTDVERAEEIGIPIAFLVLIIALGTLVSAIVPLLAACAGLVLTYGLLAVLATSFHFDTFLLSIVTMLGLGLGIDYALFVVSRFREELALRARQGESEKDAVADAVGAALATAGGTVAFSGMIVALSLASLSVIKEPFFREMAVGSVVVVLCSLMVTLILLPAVLATLGPKLNHGRLPAWLLPARSISPGRMGRIWIATVMRRPSIAAGVAIVLLVVAAVPLLNLRLGLDIGVLSAANSPSGEGERVLARSFSPGAVAPIQILIAGDDGRPLSQSAVAEARRMAHTLEDDTLVTGVGERKNNGGLLLTVVPSVPIDTLPATALVSRIRKDLAPRIRGHQHVIVLVGGATAFAADFAAEMHAKLPIVLALILGLSFFCLAIVFRSITIPIKAVLMNLLSTGATVGLVVLVFQDGYGEHLLGFSSPGFIQTYIPILVFALLFGLSMDYEVFMVRRMQEEWRQTHDNRVAIIRGVEHTARPIAAAAGIMVAVFGCFITAEILELKQLGFALGTAVALDATLVRLVLVPALMCLLGTWNWRLPVLLSRASPVDEPKLRPEQEGV
jgi:putative drug exporter of the RND superfamily